MTQTISRKYDVVISFADEDREVALEVNTHLKNASMSTFYDEERTAELWGQHLAERLEGVYSTEGRFCLMLISRHYVRRV